MSRRPARARSSESFEEIYRHFARVAAYASRRGSRDPEGIAAEAMAIAWRRIEELDREALPWLIATARNLLHAEYRSRRRAEPMPPADIEAIPGSGAGPDPDPDLEVESLDPEVDRALGALSPNDREALLLVAWEELTPAEAAASLGVSAAAFRVRLHRARRRFRRRYAGAAPTPSPMPTEATEGKP